MASLSYELGLLSRLPAAGFSHQLHLVLDKTVFTFCFKIPFPTDLHCLQGKPVDSFPVLALSWQWDTINPDIQTLHPSPLGLKRMLLAGYFILPFVKSILGSNGELRVRGRVCWMQDQTHHMGLRKKVVAANANDLAVHLTAFSGTGVVSVLLTEAALLHFLLRSRLNASTHTANLTRGTAQHPLRAEE